MICGRKPITRDTAQQPGKDEFTRAAAPPVDGACACGTAVAQRSPVLDAAQAVAYCTAAAQRTRSLRVMVSWAASPAGRPSAAARSTAVRRLVKAPLPGQHLSLQARSNRVVCAADAIEHAPGVRSHLFASQG